MIGDGGTASAGAGEASDETFVTHSTDGKCEITIDTSRAPDLKDWARTKLAPVLAEWYPKIIAALPMENYTPPPRFSVLIGTNYSGVAATDTGQSRVTANAKWFRGELDREALGALVHEEVHVIQLYRPGGARRGDSPATNAVARGGGRGGVTPDTQLTALETALGSTNKLSDAQKTKVKTALEDQSKKMADLIADASVSGADRTARMQTIRDETNKKMKDIVNAQQYAAWEQTSQRGRGRGNRGGGGGGGVGGLPGWLVEGIPDYIRWFKYEPDSHGADDVWLKNQRNFSNIRYDGLYRQSGNFLNWVAEKYDKDIVAKVNAAARQGKYSDEIWKANCGGKTAAELGLEWKIEKAKKLGIDWTPPASNSSTNSAGG